MAKKLDMNIKITSEQIHKADRKIKNIHEHLQAVKQGTGVQRNKKAYNRKQKHTKGWD